MDDSNPPAAVDRHAYFADDGQIVCGTAGSGHGLPDAGEPVSDLMHSWHTPGEGDPVVAQSKQVGGGQPGTGHVVDRNRALPAAACIIHEHDRDAIAAQLIDAGQVTAHEREQDTIGPLFLEQ